MQVKASAFPKYEGNDVSDVHRVAFLLGRLLGEIGGRSELRIYGEGLDVKLRS